MFYRLLRTVTKKPGKWEGLCMTVYCKGKKLELCDKSLCDFYWVSKDIKLCIISGPLRGCYSVKQLQT